MVYLVYFILPLMTSSGLCLQGKSKESFIMSEQQTRRSNIYDEFRMKHIQIPKVFFTNPQYLKMKNDSKIAWAILADRNNLSIKNGWFDDNGDIYFIYTNEQLARILNVSERTTQNIKKELIDNDLLEQKRLGHTRPNKLYLKRPIVTKDDVYKIQNDEENLGDENFHNSSKPSKTLNDPYSDNDRQILPVMNSKNYRSRTAKSADHEQQNLPTSNTDLNNTNFKNTDNKTNQSLLEDIAKLNVPEPIKEILKRYKQRLVDDDVLLYDIESYFKKHRDTLTMVEHENALHFVFHSKKPIGNIGGFLKIALDKQLEFRNKSVQSQKQTENGNNIIPDWLKNEKSSNNQKSEQNEQINNEMQSDELAKWEEEKRLFKDRLNNWNRSYSN